MAQGIKQTYDWFLVRANSPSDVLGRDATAEAVCLDCLILPSEDRSAARHGTFPRRSALSSLALVGLRFVNADALALDFVFETVFSDLSRLSMSV